MKNGKSQNQFVLDHMIDHGYITDIIARSYNIRRLAARVYELKAEGVRIECSRKVDDQGVQYGFYTLVDREAELTARRNGMGWRTNNSGPVARLLAVA